MRRVSISGFIGELIPFQIRKPKLVAFVRAICAPLNAINIDFELFQTQNNLLLSHNAQVASLEHFINERLADELFTSVVVRTENDKKAVLYRHFKYEAETVTYARFKSETGTPTYCFNQADRFGTHDFVIDVQEPENIPLFAKIKAEAMKLNIAGKRFKVKHDDAFILSHE